MKTKKHPIDKFCGILAPVPAPTHVCVPIELWDRFAKIVKHGRDVRENLGNWPLLPDQLACEVRRLHHWLREIDESEQFLRASLTDACGKLEAHRAKSA